MAGAVEDQDVTRLQLGCRHVRQGGPLLITGPRDRYPGGCPRSHGQPRAVIGVRPGRAENVRLADLGVGERHRLASLRARGALVRGGTAAATAATAARADGLLLRRGELAEQRLLLADHL